MILKFEAYHDGEFWCARAVGESIFTQGGTLDELSENVKEAVSLHIEEEFDQEKTNGQRNKKINQKPCINITRKF